jgi:hypothetical protein
VIGQGGSLASGGSGFGLSTGGTVLASGGQSSGGAKPSGGAASGGSALGGSTANGGSVPTGGTPASGAASGGTASSGGPTAGGASGGSDSTSGGKSSGGAPTTGGDSGGLSVSGGTASGGSGGASGGVGGCTSKQMERCDGIDNDCNSKVDELKACPDKCTGFALGGHGYMVCDVELNANKASALCEEQGMRLAWIESAEENSGLLKFIAGLDTAGRGGGIAEVSIGASDAAKEGQWHWVEGGPAFWEGGAKGSAVNGAYVNWGQGRPNNSSSSFAGEDCAGLVIDKADDGDPGEWNDVACGDTYGVLCEMP